MPLLWKDFINGFHSWRVDVPHWAPDPYLVKVKGHLESQRSNCENVLNMNFHGNLDGSRNWHVKVPYAYCFGGDHRSLEVNGVKFWKLGEPNISKSWVCGILYSHVDVPLYSISQLSLVMHGQRSFEVERGKNVKRRKHDISKKSNCKGFET